MSAATKIAENFDLAEAVSHALIEFIALQPTKSWSGSITQLVAALGDFVPEEQRAFLDVLSAGELLELAAEGQVQQDRLRLWQVAKQILIVRDDAHPFVEAGGEPSLTALGGAPITKWRQRHIELFAGLGAQSGAEEQLLGEWTVARQSAAISGCAFCGLADGHLVDAKGARAHAGCVLPLRRQEAEWTEQFLWWVRHRPEPIEVRWPPEPPVPPELRPSATPTPADRPARIRLFAAEYLVIEKGAHAERAAVYEAWAAWCLGRRIDPGTLDSFERSLELAIGSIQPERDPTPSGRTLFRGARLKDPEIDETEAEIEVAEPMPNDSLAGVVALFLRDEIAIDPTGRISAAELFAAWCRWCRGRATEPAKRPAFFGTLRRIVPGLTITRPNGKGARPRVVVGLTITGGTERGRQS